MKREMSWGSAMRDAYAGWRDLEAGGKGEAADLIAWT